MGDPESAYNLCETVTLAVYSLYALENGRSLWNPVPGTWPI